jgi:hypothetical protein
MGIATDAVVSRTPLPAGTLLPIARYRFAFRMQDDLRLPQYAGSLLRGQFGAALRRTACLTGAPTCKGCPLLATCPYPEIFEAPPPGAHRLQRFSQVPLDGEEQYASETRRAEGFNRLALALWK